MADDIVNEVDVTEEEEKDLMADVVYTVETVATMIKNTLGVTMKLVNEFDVEYIATAPVSEEQLVNLGFEFTGFSSGVKCPMYRLGANIEAIFDDTILHIYSLRS